MRIGLGCVALVMAFLAAVARGGDLPAAGSATSLVTGDSHGWFAQPTRAGAAIQHLPPRAVDALGRRGSEDGSVRLAATLAQMPDGLAAVENRLYMAFPPSASGNGSLRRQVLMVEAERGSIDGAWVGDPGGDRLPSMASLPGDGSLRGFVGSPAGPVALLDNPMRLMVLVDTAWTEVALPRAADGLKLVAIGSGIGLIDTKGSTPTLWMLALEARASSAQLSSPKWESAALSFQDADAEKFARPEGSVVAVRGQLIYGRRVGEKTEIRSVTAKGSRVLASFAGVPRAAALIPLDQSGRVALVWRTSSVKEGPGEESEQTRIAEVSAFTGQVLYEGEAQSRPMFSTFDLKVLAAFLVTVMLAIVVFVLRPEHGGLPLSLPKGVVLADPGRRMIAALIDAALAVVLASSVTRVGLSDVLSMQALAGRADVLTLYLAAVGIGLVLSTLCEWAFGKTVGKALTGCETVRPMVKQLAEGQVEPGIARVTLGRALIRNIVKWVLPPVALSGLSTPERRHRGDTAAGTVVVVREEPEGP